MNLMLHLSIIIDREKKFKPLDSGSSDYLIENKTEQMFITEFIQELENAFHIQINSYEQFEIYMLFKANTNYSLSVSDDCLRQTIGYEISELTDRFIEQINNLYLIDLSSECFTIPFSLHLKNLLFRLETGKQINNPLAESLKENSPIVFDIAAFIALDISEHYKYNVNEDEIAFLAMHIGAEIERQNENLSKIKAVLLCPNYRNMASILLNKLMLSFGNQLNIISIVHDEQSLENLHYSILFTTIPLHNFYNCEIIQVSPFNLEQQHNTIMNAILICQERKKNAKLRKNFHSFFEQDLFVADIQSCDYKEIISFLCHKLLKKNYINPDFEEMVYKRENAATTAFANIAIPHSVNMDAIKTCIAVAISKHGIKWGQNTVYLVLLLAINKADQKTFRELYESLISLFSSSSMIQKVRDCSKFEDFETLIYRELEDSPS